MFNKVCLSLSPLSLPSKGAIWLCSEANGSDLSYLLFMDLTTGSMVEWGHVGGLPAWSSGPQKWRQNWAEKCSRLSCNSCRKVGRRKMDVTGTGGPGGPERCCFLLSSWTSIALPWQSLLRFGWERTQLKAWQTPVLGIVYFALV